jgi:hypothetical protein
MANAMSSETAVTHAGFITWDDSIGIHPTNPKMLLRFPESARLERLKGESEFVSNFARGADSPWRLRLKIEEVRRSRQSAKQFERKEKSEVKSRKFVATEAFLTQEKIAILLTAHFCSGRRVSGNGEFSGNATDFITYNFTEITITTPPADQDP